MGPLRYPTAALAAVGAPKGIPTAPAWASHVAKPKWRLEPKPRGRAVGGEALGKDPRAPEEGEEKPQELHV
ncbi:putative RNA pseudouridine synthase family protein [Thermus scotoductus SA-01]|uniref:Putative RNA pseudouridine synthase family protein n=1 Tax=Thermus scotoductus (strain ATCC 700910 / SA-01) TaxID=743525 RepID=E8PJM0_THESS|nr:putative RNA pseudouridine synthase family protein [Thermus scotoductus SA-01]